MEVTSFSTPDVDSHPARLATQQLLAAACVVNLASVDLSVASLTIGRCIYSYYAENEADHHTNTQPNYKTLADLTF